MKNAKLTSPTTGRKMISNMQHTSSFAGTATLKKLKQLSEFIIIISEKKNSFDISYTKSNSIKLLSSSLEIGKWLATLKSSEVPTSKHSHGLMRCNSETHLWFRRDRLYMNKDHQIVVTITIEDEQTTIISLPDLEAGVFCLRNWHYKHLNF